MSLPKDKREVIVNDVANDVHQDWERRVGDLQKHDMPEQDARRIVEDALIGASRRWARRR